MKSELSAQLERDFYLNPEEDEHNYEAIDDEIWMMISSELAAKDDEIVAKDINKKDSEIADGMEAHAAVKDEDPSFSSSSKFENDIKGIKSKADSKEPEIEDIDDVKDDGKEVPVRVGTVSTMITSHIQLSPEGWQQRQLDGTLDSQCLELW